jgi:UDP-N-acetylglucosamine--N-acetylmuramyl-(pentapeptide) pyrophosphoryl-undecaprenol N-acetylglucosamine transferase
MGKTAAVPSRPLSVVIAGGGTGGHLYPGIAVARELLRMRPDAAVSFAGTARGLEARVIPREGLELDVIRSAGLKGKSWSARWRGALLLLPSAIDAWRVLSKRAPSVVIGVGGYSSGPVVLLAAMRGIPTMVLEQNAVPGLTNRWLAHVVKAAAVTYDETRRFFGERGFVAGNPVRQEFFQVGRSKARSGVGPRLLVLGGSQGAHVINRAVVEAAPDLARRCAGLEVVHQTGERDLESVRQGYERSGVTARAAAFLDPVVDEVVEADLVIARAGATTLAELAAAGRPAVLVPFGAATDDHQRRNARALAEAGAAVIVDERELTPAALADAVAAILGDAARLAAMGDAMRRLARPDAASRIVTRLLELVA